jgi:hypothetical protein
MTSYAGRFALNALLRSASLESLSTSALRPALRAMACVVDGDEVIAALLEAVDVRIRAQTTAASA